MKQLYFLLLFVCFSIFILTTGFAQAPTNGLVAYYPFNGNANDASGNGKHGVLQNGPTLTTDRKGNANSAYTFDGIDDWINIGTNFNFNASFTISLHCSTISFGNNPSLFTQGQPVINGGLHIALIYQSTYRFAFYGNDLEASSNFPPLNTWAHYVFTYNHQTQSRRVYLNGLMIANDTSVPYTGSGITAIGKNIVQDVPNGRYNGKLDDIRIYNRALSDAEVAALYASENVSTSSISIVKLPEDIYQANYNVLQQSIVHRYYQVRNASSDLPLAGVKLKYKLSNKSNETFESTVSDAKGLVDLKISIGGNNQLITNDDIIPAGVQNVAVSFESATATNQTLNVNTNQFNANDFTISAYAEQQPEEKEYGVATGIGASIGVIKGAKFQLGALSGEASIASASVGATFGGIVTIKPDVANEEIWEVTVNGTQDYEGKAEVGPKLEAEVATAIQATAGLTFDVSVLGGLRNESVYKFNVNQDNLLYYTAYKILLMKSTQTDDRYMRAANFFKRMSQNPLTLVSKGQMNSISLGGGASGGIGISASYAKNSNISTSIEIGAEANGEIGLENKKSLDIATGEETDEGAINYGSSVSIGFSTALEQDLGSDRELTYKVPNPLFWSTGESVNMGFERKLLNNQLSGYNISFSNNKSETFGGYSYEVDYTNELELNGYMARAVSDFYKNNSSSNLYGKFLIQGKVGYISPISAYAADNNYYKNFVGFSQRVGDIANALNSPDGFTQRKIRTYTNKFGLGFEFGAGLGIELGFSLNLEGWSSHAFILEEYTYLPSMQRIVKTIDRPFNNNFITLPTQDPFQLFFDRVTTRLLQETSSRIQTAYDSFVQKIYEPISTTLTRIFTNLGASQLALSGEKLNKVVDSKNNTNSQSPSVLTFNVPPAPSTFNAGTEVRFSYFYPENQLKTPIGVDTFQIVSDVFYLNALVGQTRLATVPNGNFTVSTSFSNYDLSRASLPLGSLVKLVFKQEGTSNWIILGDVNTTISYNKLGVFAIAAKLQTDRISPEIYIVEPTPTVNSFVVSISEAQSGVNWAGTSFVVNGQEVPFTRNETTNTFNVPLTNIPTPTDGVYRITVSTSDLAYNTAVKNWKYPCEKDLTINSVISSVPFTQKVSGAITINANVPQNSNLSLQAGKSIIFGPGFEMKNGKTMKAEVKGCEN